MCKFEKVDSKKMKVGDLVQYIRIIASGMFLGTMQKLSLSLYLSLSILEIEF